MRRKLTLTLFSITAIILIAFPTTAFCADALPTIEAISFKNAKFDKPFKSDVQEYTISLENNEVSPTLESYKIKGDANLFVTYTYNETNRQTGMTATLQYETGSTIYHFIYSNPASYEINSNNTLSSIYCNYGEVMPTLNADDTSYKLYIPKDLTELTITPVTSDIHAYCAPVELILDDKQAPKITLYSTASDGSKREYSLNIKRVDKTVEQVRAEMEQPNYTSFVQGTRIYEKPEVQLGVVIAISGIILLVILFTITKRITINPYDKEEKPFYSEVE